MSESDNKQSRAQFWPSGDETPLELNSYTIEEIADIVDQLPDALDTSDATAEAGDILAGETAYVNGSKVTGTYEPLDTSDATATATDIVSGATAYVNGSKVTGTRYNGEKVFVKGESASNDLFQISVKDNGSGLKYVYGSELGDATADKVVSGATFTSMNGLKLTGALTVPDLSNVTATAKYVAKGYSFVDADGNTVEGIFNSKVEINGIDGSVTVQGYITKPGESLTESFIQIPYDVLCLGDAKAADVLSGKTFSSHTDGKVIVEASGTMPNNGAVTSTVDPMTITDGQSLDTAIAKGYHNGSGKITVDNTNTVSSLNDIIYSSASTASEDEGISTQVVVDGDMSSNLPGAMSDLDTHVNTTQANLISQIMTALEGKATGGSSATVTISYYAYGFGPSKVWYIGPDGYHSEVNAKNTDIEVITPSIILTYDSRSLNVRGDLELLYSTSGYCVFALTSTRDVSWMFGNCCFVSGTQIAYDLDGNTKAIETFAEGDDVVSYNIETGEKYISKLKKLIINENTTDIATVSFANGEVITMNAYHPIYCEDGWHSITQHKGYAELRVGDVAKTFDGWSEVVEIKRYTSEPIVTYNLDVQDVNESVDDNTNDNYFANGICAHNPCPT